MDIIDRKILELLQEDGRITIIQLSKKLNLSRPSVNERLRRLQENGVIQGFAARISHEAIGKNTLVIIQIGNIKIECHRFEEIIKEEMDILECHRVTGANSYFMKAAVTSMKDVTALVDRLIPYGQLNTSVVLSSPVIYRPLLPVNDC
ncbi:Lrp/AsnC family transcriptional regulator [Bacillus pseudomycoides]|uniref:Lrp/AsnC family transcriptional regulator n=1 Tax=Bacillus TaxID=1386 RepID=UPI0001A1958D|nr:Lrp/AsnC family transcriptional regulator [Bacillus pseudomycoides]EEM13855.1 Transcriptional regulator, Lrp/AsnC [Bacillus pseudomycoides DSM 12442]MED1597525.1 Lrp/AsnC family transcriptional regulator [Bacillus pseudomycoides]MED4712605.1 Lrp/AsnC family transcriptional regulator [Bacillus pseudomycoides]OOR48380.1 AsnC family transcriptional regulator [Bacillus pseudomycoides]PDX97536.1 Lrp/AsnC family transcriptional regulator [Bacillus pseudomycoides]